jgi:putative ABC transport system substrate-binding protein
MLAAVLTMAFLFSPEARAGKRIGVLVWNNETRYLDSQKGLLEQLKKNGFTEPKVSYIMEEAGGSKAKASEVAKKFAGAKLDLVLVIGTTAAVAVAKEVKDTPVVFSMVYDPVDAKIADGWKSSGNNTTGSSPRVPMSILLQKLKQLAAVKTIAVLYTPGEKNTEAQLKELQAEQQTSQIKVVPLPLLRNEDVANTIAEAANSVDAFYFTGSSIVGGSLPAILDAAIRAKIVTVTHLDDLVEKGVMFGVCANAYDVGKQAGDKATQVLKGAKPSSLPIGVLKKLDVMINMKTAKASQIPIPAALKSTAKIVQ